MIVTGLAISAALGAIIGSFLNVLILRLPLDQKLNGRSHCPDCKHPLNAFDLIPVFSYIFLRGKCRYCKKTISTRYIAVELVTALIFALNFYFLPYAGNNFYYFTQLLRWDFIAAVLIAVFAIDYEHFLILNKLILPASAILAVFNFVLYFAAPISFWYSMFWLGLLSAAALYAFLAGIHYLSRGGWMGLGDAKLGIFLGLAVSFPLIILNVFMAFMIGAVFGLALIAVRVKKLNSKIPFGTFLALSCIITLYFGPQILIWYLKLIGWY